MNSKERVLTALKRVGVPDRVPLQFDLSCLWRHYFKERHRDFYAELKSLNPDLIIAHHCDGAVAPILSEWVEAGLEVFNPVQPHVPGHEPEVLKSRFGDRLSFWGAVDQQRLLPFGTPAEIQTEVKRLIAILGEGGVYDLPGAHHPGRHACGESGIRRRLPDTTLFRVPGLRAGAGRVADRALSPRVTGVT